LVRGVNMVSRLALTKFLNKQRKIKSPIQLDLWGNEVELRLPPKKASKFR
jgi:hypothetical protein